MVAGSATTRGIATLLARPSGAASAVPLITESLGVRANREEPAAQPGRIEKRPHKREADDRKNRPEEWSRDARDEIHISNNAQGW